MYKGLLFFGLVTALTAQTFTTVVDFNGINGDGPVGGPVSAADGNYYGVTSGGSEYGSFYRLTPSGSLTTLYNFRAADGGFPAAGLMQARDGNFYGITGQRSGVYGGVFKVTASGVLTVLHTFSSTGCYGPNSPLIQAAEIQGAEIQGAEIQVAEIQVADGDLYGTTSYGGRGGCIFRIATGGNLTVLHSFGPDDGGTPLGLVQSSDGNFYGVTATGGPKNAGSIFKVTAAGVFTTIYTFNGPDGSGPLGALTALADGNLYGLTSAGGSAGNGTVFRITPAGALTTLHSFSGVEGSGPRGGLLLSSDGSLYGATQYGGLNSSGTIFKVTLSGALTTIHHFGSNDGAFPWGGLTQGPDGNIYGAAPQGGKYGRGALFKFALGGAAQPPTIATIVANSVSGAAARLVATVSANGADTQAWFVYGTDRSLTGGVTSQHQAIGSSPSAVAFTLPVSRLNLNTTYYFQAFASNRAGVSSSPIASFTTASYSTYNLYGTVSLAGKGLAGVNVVLDGNQTETWITSDSGDYYLDAAPGGNFTVTPVAIGYIFTPPSASFTNLNSDHMVNFTAVPAASMPPLTTLIAFNGSNGQYPTGLMQARDGNLYGATSSGGANNQGTIFRVTPAGELTTMHSFARSDGATPAKAPVHASDGNLYGVTTAGGSGGAGTVYQQSLTGDFKSLMDFGIQNGPSPRLSLVQGNDGNLYGATLGGFFSAATVFRISPAGAMTTLYTFNSRGGSSNGPPAGLLQTGDGNFYGVLNGARGFTSDPGLIFKMTPAGAMTAAYVFCALTDCADGLWPSDALIQGGDGNIYGTTSGGADNGAGVAFRLTPAGVMTVLHSFSVAEGGPSGPLLWGMDGNLYGATSASAGMAGTIFQLTPAAGFTILHRFNTTDGAGPVGPLVQAADGSLYGVTTSGGEQGGGTVFRLALPKATPTVNPSSGVVSAASFQPGIAPGSWITILGSNLSPQTGTWSNSIVNGALPQSLNGVSVKIGGQSAYVAYVSAGQINALAPDLSPGDVAVTVSTVNGTSASVTASVQTFQPSFFQWGQYAVATRIDYTDAVKNGAIPGLSTLPAKPGEVVVLWGTGFGPSSPPVPQGVEVPASTAYNTANPVTVTIGGTPATIFGAALTPGAAGLYQIAIQVPTTLADGDYPVVASVSGVKSPAGVSITVQR